MKSKRKPNNGFARAERSCRALLRTNHVAVVNIDPSGSQVMVNWKSCRQIRSVAVANAIFDFSYHWTIYIAAMCRDERGAEYIKSVEISPEGIYKVERLTDAIELTTWSCATAPTRTTLWRQAGSPSQTRFRWMRPRPRSCSTPPAHGIR
ncbi:hypothetical protein AK973_1003 [Pseudomonas brassicacearum]|nr:hypothetical protein AK973_1003 [Pseudomonas brassicacearum]